MGQKDDEGRAIASGTVALVNQAGSRLGPDGLRSTIAVCKASDILTIGEGAPPEIVTALDTYFSTFAKPDRSDGKLHCCNCGEALDGMMHTFGVGVAAVWDLAHGEAHCSGCRWPMRGMHYPKDADGKEIMSLRNFFLSYHPSQLAKVES